MKVALGNVESATVFIEAKATMIRVERDAAIKAWHVRPGTAVSAKDWYIVLA